MSIAENRLLRQAVRHHRLKGQSVARERRNGRNGEIKEIIKKKIDEVRGKKKAEGER